MSYTFLKRGGTIFSGVSSFYGLMKELFRDLGGDIKNEIILLKNEGTVTLENQNFRQFSKLRRLSNDDDELFSKIY